MARELWELWLFFCKKLRKGNGVWWALGYTRFRWQWLRFQARHETHTVRDTGCWLCDPLEGE